VQISTKDAPSRTNAGREVKETEAFLDGNGDDLIGKAERKRLNKPVSLLLQRLIFPDPAATALRRVTAISVKEIERGGDAKMKETELERAFFVHEFLQLYFFISLNFFLSSKSKLSLSLSRCATRKPAGLPGQRHEQTGHQSRRWSALQQQRLASWASSPTP